MSFFQSLEIPLVLLLPCVEMCPAPRSGRTNKAKMSSRVHMRPTVKVILVLVTCHTSVPLFTEIKPRPYAKQESPPAWTQEAYRPPCSKYSLCCPNWVPPGQGTPPARVPPPPARVPPSQGTPPPHGILGNVAKHYGIWVPPPVDRQIDGWMDGHTSVKTLPSRRTTYAGGKYEKV